MIPLIFQIVGILTLVIYVFRAGVVAARFYLTNPSISKNLQKYGAGKQCWAIITGATDGIGLALAVLLAKSQFNIVLISRNQEKLNVPAAELEKLYGIQTRTLALDFSTVTLTESLTFLEDLFKSIDHPTVLINNVGISHDHPSLFTEDTLPFLHSMININVTSAITMTHMFLQHPSIRTSNTKKLVLNIGSFAGLNPSPYLATYSGTKAFLQGWTEALALESKMEYKDMVDIKLVQTYFVVSKMSKIRKPTALAPSATVFAQSVLSHGLSHNGGNLELTSATSPYHTHGWVNFLIHYFGPTALWREMGCKTMGGLRRKWVKKQGRERQSVEGENERVKEE